MSTATEPALPPDPEAPAPPRRCARLLAARAGAIIATACLALLAAACGVSPSSSGSQASATASPIAFARCMRAHGVRHWPDPTASGSFDKAKLTPRQLGVSGAQIQAAQASCVRLLPAAPNAPAHLEAARALRFSQCMRAHGVTNFPDPGSSGRIPDPASVGIDQGSPLFQAANQACRTYRPGYIPSNAAYAALARTHGR